MGFLHWIEIHEAELTVLAAIGSAIATIAIAMLTYNLAKENRILRKAGTEPKIVAYLMLDQNKYGAINFCLANVGQGPALKVSFSVKESYKSSEIKL